MNMSTLNRLTMSVVISAALAAFSFPIHAQPQSNPPGQQTAEEKQAEQDKQDAQDKKDKKAKQDAKNEKKDQQQQNDQKQAQQQEQKRLSKQQQEERIREQQQNEAQFRLVASRREAALEQKVSRLQQQKRMAQYRFQQDYFTRMRQQQARYASERYDYYNDPFYYTPSNYRYRRDGRYYETNQYGADIIRQALNYGYQEGFHAGRADREDGWRFDYRQSYAYEDANYGYYGRYVRQDEYNYYFREGFQRGYDDGYYSRRRYGSNSNGSDILLGAVIGALITFEVMH